jgi:hypothetical protein
VKVKDLNGTIRDFDPRRASQTNAAMEHKDDD